ncbi:zinc ribbon domain-containing protein [Natrialbaceae archaeon A-CW2]
MSRTITAVGAYVPQARLPAEAVSEAWGRFDGAGIRSTAVPGADEDTLTMAGEAARRALEAADLEAAELEAVTFATTTPPLEEAELAVRLGAFLGTGDSTRHETAGASTNAGVAALADAFEGDAGPHLVVASDAPRGEPDSAQAHAAGAGAAAFVLESSGGARCLARADAGLDYPGTRFREAGSSAVDSLGITPYEREAFTETIGRAIDGLGESFDPASADAVAVQAPNGKLPYRASGILGVDTDVMTEHAVVHDLGDLGAASVPLSLASALAAGEETILGVGYGSGSVSTILALEAGESDDAGAVSGEVDLESDETISYADSLRLRGEITGGEPAGGGAYVSVPSWQRSTPQRYRLEAGECPSCGALNFLPQGACRRCHELVDYEPVQLEREGTIETVSVISQGGAPPEFAELQARAGDYATAIVAFDGPGESDERASAPLLIVDADPESVSVGDRVEATVRRIYTQEGVTRYGIKARPLE